MPVLLDKIALVDIVSAEGEAHCELSDFWIVDFDAGEDNIATSGPN